MPPARKRWLRVVAALAALALIASLVGGAIAATAGAAAPDPVDVPVALP